MRFASPLPLMPLSPTAFSCCPPRLYFRQIFHFRLRRLSFFAEVELSPIGFRCRRRHADIFLPRRFRLISPRRAAASADVFRCFRFAIALFISPLPFRFAAISYATAFISPFSISLFRFDFLVYFADASCLRRLRHTVFSPPLLPLSSPLPAIAAFSLSVRRCCAIALSLIRRFHYFDISLRSFHEIFRLFASDFFRRIAFAPPYAVARRVLMSASQFSDPPLFQARLICRRFRAARYCFAPLSMPPLSILVCR